MSLRNEESIQEKHIQESEENPALKAFFAVLPNEIANYIIKKNLPFSLAGTMFAQTSLYWRSYFYRQQLAHARYICDEEAQERTLTHLLINLSLLKKDPSTESKADRTLWIAYLKEYSADTSLAVHHRLLANALWLALDVNHTQMQWNKFVYLLWINCAYESRAKTEFYFSLMRLVMQACGDKLAIDTPAPNVDRVFSIYSPETFFEAQIVLAPYMDNVSSEILDRIEKAYTQTQNHMSYIRLLHVAMQLIPQKDSFWKNPKNVFGYVRRHINLLESHESLSVFSFERSNLFITLINRTGHDFAAEVKSPSEDMSNRYRSLFLNLLNNASDLRALCRDGDEDDKKRLESLTVLISFASASNETLCFIPRLCAKLKTDAPRREAVEMLWNYEEEHNSKHNIIINTIKTLFLSQKLSIEKKDLGKRFLEYICQTENMNLDVLVSSLDFLEDEVYTQVLSQGDPVKKMFLMPEVFKHLKTPQCISAWILKLGQELDEEDPTNRDYEYYLKAKAYTVLLCKQGDQLALAKWNYQITTQFNEGYGAFCLSLIEVILPYLDLAEKLVWMDLLLDICSNEKRFPLLHKQNLSELLQCMTIGLASLPLEIKMSYSSHINNLFLTIPIAANLGVLFCNLFQHVSEEHFSTREQRISFQTKLTL